MADVVTPIPTGPIIPQEYQDQIDQARRRQMIAQMLQQQAMQNKGPQQVGPVAAKISPLAALANVAQMGVGGYLDSSAMSDASTAKSQFEKDQLADLQRIQSTPEPGQVAAAQISKFPQNQAIGRALQGQMEKRREEAAKIAGTAGDEQGAMNLLSGQTPVNQYQAKQYPAPQIKYEVDTNDPSGQRKIPYIYNYDKNGRPTISPGSSMTQTVNLPGKEGELAATREQSELGSMQNQAQTAQATLATAQRLTQALQDGGVTGGGGDLKQTARKFFQAFDINLPETGPTDVARTQLGAGMLANINKLGRNPTDYDEKLMQRLIGSLDTDPNAMPQLIAFMTAQAHKSLQDFGDFVDIKRNGPAAKTYPGLYDTADVGIRTPKELFGPMDLQMRTMQALKQAGGDITRFRDPSGKPFDANSKFDIKNAPLTPPSTPAAVTAPAAAPQIYINPTTGERGSMIDGVWTLLPKQ